MMQRSGHFQLTPVYSVSIPRHHLKLLCEQFKTFSKIYYMIISRQGFEKDIFMLPCLCCFLLRPGRNIVSTSFSSSVIHYRKRSSIQADQHGRSYAECGLISSFCFIMPLFVHGNEVSAGRCDPETLLCIVELLKASQEFCKLPVRKLDAADKVLYVTQREYATVSVDDEFVRFVGSEDATTCHIVIMKTNSVVSVGHFDGADTKNGIIGMINEIQNKSNNKGGRNVEDKAIETEIEIHIFGGFIDDRGISKDLFTDLLINLHQSPIKINVMTASVYHINNEFVLGNNRPIIHGVAIDIRNGDVFPATFAEKGPCEIMRHARIFGGSQDMFSIYNRKKHSLILAPFLYNVPYFAPVVLELDDNEILEHFSTSPHCEPEDFATNTREAFKFLIEHPKPEELFVNCKPLEFKIDENGKWL